jgi:hypothetical protein
MAVGWFLVASLCAYAACSSDHEGLKLKPPGNGGTGGSLVDADIDLDSGSDVADVIPEPEGTPYLTLFHAVVDSPKIAFCFSKVVDGVVGPALGSPMPSGGLEFGHSLVLDSIAGLDWKADDILTTVVAGDFALFAGKSCEEAIALAKQISESDAGDAGDAGVDAAEDADSDAETAPPPPPDPPAVRASDLPVLPAPTLGKGYSYLLAAAGCIGGPAFVDPDQLFLCGPGYSPETPTLAPVVVKMSRIVQGDRVGLQVVNAALGADPVDVSSAGPPTRSLPGLDIAYGVAAGAIAPQTPNLDYSKTLFGNPITGSTLQVTAYGSAAISFETGWEQALDLGGLSDIEEGKSYVIVLAGPRPTLIGMKWWNPPRLAVLPSEPLQ